MKASQCISCIMLSGALLMIPMSIIAAPSPGIRALLETPASVFDVFLHQLYVASNGPTYFGGPNMKEQIRIFRIDYDYASNLISISFHIGPEHRLMRGFSRRDIKGKKDILLNAAQDIAISLGLEAGNRTLRYGLIQSLKIRNGWTSNAFDENQVKEEIANRTVFELVCAWEEETLYRVRRTQSGDYDFSMDLKPEKFRLPDKAQPIIPPSLRKTPLSPQNSLVISSSPQKSSAVSLNTPYRNISHLLISPGTIQVRPEDIPR